VARTYGFAEWHSHLGEKIDRKTWQETILGDLAEFKKAGLTSPDFNGVRELLASHRTTKPNNP
jgi:hypothetical protein